MADRQTRSASDDKVGAAPRLADGIAPERRSASCVALVRTTAEKERVFEAVREAMELARWREFITPGADVALKPNLGWDKLIPGATSAPWVVEGVVRTICDHVGSMHMVEADQVVVRAEKALRVSGLDEVCSRYGITWHNMSREPHVRVRLDSRRVLKDIHIPEILTRTELITLPLLKTHNKTTITGALKNQWGCLPALRHQFHLVLADALADVNTLVQPRFAVMDATVGLEGNGPKSGVPKEMNLVLASANLVGTDATAARLMGFDPTPLEHLQRCAEDGLGSLDGFAVEGESVADAMDSFAPARHNAVSWLELSLRKSTIRWLVFDTPLFHLMCFGARRYYDLWDLLVGRKIRESFFRRSAYADQWRS